MTMVNVDTIAAHSGNWLSTKLQGSAAARGAVLHSLNESGELSQWLCHDDSTINIVMSLLLLLLRRTYKAEN